MSNPTFAPNREERRRAASQKRRGGSNTKKGKQEIRVVEFPEGQPEPLFVKAPDIGKVILGLSPSTAANWRSQGIGPEYHVIGGSVYYEFQVLKEFFSGGLVQTTGDLAQLREADLHV